MISVNLNAKQIESVKDFANNVKKLTTHNNGCKIDNYQLIEIDEKFNKKLKETVSAFDLTSLKDFDMGECLSLNNLRDGAFVTHFWQKNTQTKNHKLDLFISYNFKENQLLTVIIDNDDNAYLAGNQSENLKLALSENPIYANNFKDINLDSKLEFSDLKIKEQERVDIPLPELIMLDTINKTPIAENEIGSQWNLSCKKDRFNGMKSCFMNYEDVMVGIINGNYSVYIGHKHYPNTTSAIKVDGNDAIYGYEGHSKLPVKVIEQMKRGKIAYTRYKEWPYEYNRDREIDLTGFTFKFNEMVQRYRNL